VVNIRSYLFSAKKKPGFWVPGVIPGVEKPGFCGEYRELSVFSNKETRFLGSWRGDRYPMRKIVSTYPLPTDRYPMRKIVNLSAANQPLSENKIVNLSAANQPLSENKIVNLSAAN
jgi:hypothetical protein